MNTSISSLGLGLEDILGDLTYARRTGDLGRMALLIYCEVRRWAREAGEPTLATGSSELITQSPQLSREGFLSRVDGLILELEQVHSRFAGEAPGR